MMKNLRIISQTLKSIQIQSRSYSSPATQSENVTRIVTELSNLTLLETMDLTQLLRKKLDVSEVPVMASMMGGIALQGSGGSGKGAGAAAKGTEKKVEEKTAFDLMLQGFDTAAKLKVIKEVRTITKLGLKEAKELVEKAPSLLSKDVGKEEAEKIIEKLKAVGAKVTME